MVSWTNSWLTQVGPFRRKEKGCLRLLSHAAGWAAQHSDIGI
jgi:hypothetical protein